jgi:DNA-binding transcriptional ArsR family regulator
MVATRTKAKEKTGAAALIKALGHPLRAQALTILTERTASPNELAKELDEGLSQVSYHVKVLSDLGLIELQDTQPRRGAVEHYYRALERPLLDTPEWERLDPLARQAFSGYIVETLIGDAARAIETSTFDRRDDRHLSRTPLLLDEEGWRETVAAFDGALQVALDAQAASSARMNTSGEPGIQTIAGLLCFEVPARSKEERVQARG